eukprot:Seg9266.1 transcript_id=Seg9266.1/GoldUCD/mRNA.D3Y31 product="hypothetical protein" protein_id=Seg9266.1/GoldUCD/D3Y31
MVFDMTFASKAPKASANSIAAKIDPWESTGTCFVISDRKPLVAPPIAIPLMADRKSISLEVDKPSST